MWIKSLAQGNNTNAVSGDRTRYLSISSPTLYHCTTALNFHFLMIQLVSSSSSPVVDVGPLLEQQQFRRLDNMKAHCFAVSGSRHTATVVSYKNTHHENMCI